MLSEVKQCLGRYILSRDTSVRMLFEQHASATHQARLGIRIVRGRAKLSRSVVLRPEWHVLLAISCSVGGDPIPAASLLGGVGGATDDFLHEVRPH